jgi:hypothetical protein
LRNCRRNSRRRSGERTSSSALTSRPSQFIIHDTARDPAFGDNHLLSYLAQDFLQSAVALISLSMEGLINVARRELRFIVGASIKLCFVQQKEHGLSVAERLALFDRELASQRISITRNFGLRMLPEELQERFAEETGRIYGLTSNYVHLSPRQIEERIAAVEAGRTAGKESAADIEALDALVSRTLAVSLVLLFHSTPDWVAGDWFVEGDGSTVGWVFTASRFLAGMDSHFDYKAERQQRLGEIQAARQAGILF